MSPRSVLLASVGLAPIGREQAAVLGNLFQLYAHDFSEHVPLDVNSNGRFHVAISDEWWTDADHHPFFISPDGRLSGFALVRRGSRVDGARDVMDVAEFFVLRGARGRNLGTRVAHVLFDAFPGPWEIRVRRANVLAWKFWSRASEAWAGGSVAQTPLLSKGVDWDVLRVTPLVA
jgi:predicted acetyltransferase